LFLLAQSSPAPARGVVLALGDGLGTLFVTAATKHPGAEAKRRVRAMLLADTAGV